MLGCLCSLVSVQSVHVYGRGEWVGVFGSMSGQRMGCY